MSDLVKLTDTQLHFMKCCIGWQHLRKPHRGVFMAYRNFLICYEKHYWIEELCELGLVKNDVGYHYEYLCYRVTNKGIKYLEERFSVKIRQYKEDIVEENYEKTENLYFRKT